MLARVISICYGVLKISGMVRLRIPILKTELQAVPPKTQWCQRPSLYSARQDRRGLRDMK